jgi:hypothetical protein
MKKPEDDTKKKDGKYNCENCHDTGYVCAECRAPDGECTCLDGPGELERCDACD